MKIQLLAEAHINWVEKMESPVELPEDMVRKILTKLPVTTMVRFSCVCKLWRNFVIEIRNPNLFGEWHLDSPNNLCNDQVFFRHQLGMWDDIIPVAAPKDSLLTHKMSHALAPHPYQDDPLFQVKCWCNGIVCLAHRDTGVVHLYNPIAREVLKLPPVLVNDQDKEVCIFGFGLDASSNDYKVIRIIRQHSCSDQEIYKLSTRCWNKLELDYVYLVFKEHQAVMFFNGFFHWSVLRCTNDEVNCREMILTFNFQTEKLGEMQYPPDQLSTCIGLTEMDDSLAVYSGYDTKFKVWVMSEYGKKESWTMKFSVHLSVRIYRVVSVRVYDMSLVVLASYDLLDSWAAVGWVREEENAVHCLKVR